MVRGEIQRSKLDNIFKGCLNVSKILSDFVRLEEKTVWNLPDRKEINDIQKVHCTRLRISQVSRCFAKAVVTIPQSPNNTLTHIPHPLTLATPSTTNGGGGEALAGSAGGW